MLTSLPRPVVVLVAGAAAVLAFMFAETLSVAKPLALAAKATDRDCSDFDTQRQAQKFFQRHDPFRDPHRLDEDADRIACEALHCPCWAGGSRKVNGFDNGEWVIAKGNGAGIPEDSFEVRVDGASIGRTRLLTFANRLRRTSRFPQVLVIASSGYLRLKPGGDPTPPLPFGQSLVLGPAIFGASTSFPSSTLFFNPQIQRVDVDTGKLRRNGTGALLLRVVARDRKLAATSANTNQVMDLAWKIVLYESTAARTRLRVDGTFRFTERVVPDPVRTAEFQSFRLLQVSSMFIDDARHDVDAFRFRSNSGLINTRYQPAQANLLLPASPSPLAARSTIVDSVHTDDSGQPNGNTPSYRIRVRKTTGPVSGPLTPRAFFNDSQDLNDDNLGLWIHRQPAGVILAGTRGAIGFDLVATADPLRTP